MAKTEKTSPDIATLAARALRKPGSMSKSEIKALAGAALTHASDTVKGLVAAIIPGGKPARPSAPALAKASPKAAKAPAAPKAPAKPKTATKLRSAKPAAAKPAAPKPAATKSAAKAKSPRPRKPAKTTQD